MVAAAAAGGAPADGDAEGEGEAALVFMTVPGVNTFFVNTVKADRNFREYLQLCGRQMSC